MTEQTQGGAQERPSRPWTVLLPTLDWAFAQITGTWLRPGEMISCPMPDHDDSTPSFNLWSPDEEGVPQRWGCFGCSRGGDVVDLIEALEGPDNVWKRIQELYEAEQNDDGERPRSPVPKKPPRDLTAVYNNIVDAMAGPEFDRLQQFMREKGLDGEALEMYAMDEWDWAATTRAVVIPHRDTDGTITGLRYRKPDKKSETGSIYNSLYGVWRNQGHEAVLICEGETDTLWAAYNLAREDKMDVFGLPSGASQTVREEWLEQLKDRTVIVAFDSDETGMQAARKWCSVRPGTLVARLPEGEDLLSCGIPVQELIERAAEPRRASGLISIENDVFVKAVKDGSAPVADFAFKPERELITDEGPAWEGRLTGDRRKLLLRASDLHSSASLIRWSNKNGRAWTGGSGPAVQGVLNHLASESAFMPLERASTKAGKIGRSFVGPNFCIGPDRVRYIPPALGDAKLGTRLHIEDGPWDARAILALERLNDPAVMATLLGWLCATLLRGERAPAPPLFVSGESGAGKTNLLSTLLRSFGFATETNLTTTTPYGVDCMVSSSIGLPIWFDEYRGGAREDSMMRLRQLLRDAYYGQPSIKGGMTNQATELTEVTTWAGLVVSGEMGTHETSHRDRMVAIDLNPKAKNREAYIWLQDRKRTHGLGWALINFLMQRPDVLYRIEPAGGDDLPDRARDTLGFLQAGWQAWLEFRWEHSLRDTPVGPDLDRLSDQRREAEDPWLEAIKAAEGTYDRNGNPVVEQQNRGVVLIPAEVIVEAKRVGIELPARANELVQWLKRRYVVHDVRVSSRRGKMVEDMKL